MMDFDIKGLVPRFIWNDRNGHALCKAMEAGLNDFLDVCRLGLDTWGNVENMPEWRLDEMAWEYNIPYDYTAETSVKRSWIAGVFQLSRMYGTSEGIRQYMGGYFDETTLEENWEYGGDPFHFRALFSGSWTPESVAWATTAINAIKNVRSVLDSYTFKGQWPHNIYAGCALYTYESGTYHLPAVEITSDWYIDEIGNMLLDEDGILLIVEG